MSKSKGKSTKFNLDKSGCHHFMATREVEKNVLESSCVYCGTTVNYPKVNQTSENRRSRIEDKIRQDSLDNNQKIEAKSECGK